MLLSMVVPVSASEGIYVNYHSQEDISKYLRDNQVNSRAATDYQSAASFTTPYSEGTLTEKSLKEALQLVNAIRYIAGIDANVTLSDKYNQQAQAAALINAVNNSLSHFPVQPLGMQDSLFQLASEGASGSNIAWASWKSNLGYSILDSWMYDGDDGNINRTGHRRWILNPTMKQTGFGWVYSDTGTYTSMYVFDGIFESTDYYGVAWPAQNMPITYFGNDYPWTISMGTKVDASKVKVVLTRNSDNKEWKFSTDSADGYFNVENGNYGQTGCIIFKPQNINYSAGDVFHVAITGLDRNVEYDVHFFKPDENTSCEKHTYGDYIVFKQATKKKNGIKRSICSECGKIKEKVIYKVSTIKLKKKRVTYNGKVRKPKVVIKDSRGKAIPKKYYKIYYGKTPKKVGTYKVKVKLQGIYKGTKTLKFEIIK